MTWHVPENDLVAYARGELTAPALRSADTHLASCEQCRRVLTQVSDPAALDAGWERLNAALDAARPGLLRRLLVRLGVMGNTPR
jgi:anti-sigma factor RsiW